MAKLRNRELIRQLFRRGDIVVTWRQAGDVAAWLADQTGSERVDFAVLARLLQNLGTDLGLLVLLELSHHLTAAQRNSLAEQLALGAARAKPKELARLRVLAAQGNN